MLRELVKRWESHKILTKWLSYVFSYLDRQFVPDKRTTLHEVGVTFFRDLVYQEVSAEARNTVIFLVSRLKLMISFDGKRLYIEIEFLTGLFGFMVTRLIENAREKKSTELWCGMLWAYSLRWEWGRWISTCMISNRQCLSILHLITTARLQVGFLSILP